MIIKHSWRLVIYAALIMSLFCISHGDLGFVYGQEQAQPVIIDGDSVEYSADAKKVIAHGNVVIKYHDAVLTCDKIAVDTQTKDAQASGNVRLQDARGILEAEELIYNLDTKKGNIQSAKFRSSPYYYFGESIQRQSEEEYIIDQGSFSSCNLDNPHFRVKSKRVELFPGDKIIARSNVVYWKNLPFFYMPYYSYSLKDPFMKVQFKAGKTSDWGIYTLSAWRTDLNDNANLRLYLDYRYELGFAQGFGLNYDTIDMGRGDFKFYYTQERPAHRKGTPIDGEDNLRQEFQRYMGRLRHMWNIDENTQLTAEYYRIEDDRREWDSDADFLRDYFYREYEKDMQPKSYLLVSHTWPFSNINMLIQKGTNRWYNAMTEKLPEISYDLPSCRIGESRLYFNNQTKFSHLLDYPPPGNDVVRFDSYNQFILPAKFMFLDLAPYMRLRETVYNRDTEGGCISPRTTFYTGIDMSTKVHRIFKANSDFLGLDINGLRHMITPSIQYGYIHEPTIAPSKLHDFDDIDRIDGDNRFTLELENKLQTKREDKTTDLAIFRVSSDYIMYSRRDSVSKAQDRFLDFLFDLELMPYAWLRIETDATYDHRQDYFSIVNVDNWLNFSDGRSLGLGHRYTRGGSKEMTSQLLWRINPKWKVRLYGRYQFGRTGDYRSGLREQEYTIYRDLHCAVMEITLNRKKKLGAKTEESIWCKFDLKIFKESEFDYVQSYHPPKLVD